MAEEFVKCLACGKEFNKSAQSCPGCGKVNPLFSRLMKRIALIAIPIVIALIVVMFIVFVNIF